MKQPFDVVEFLDWHAYNVAIDMRADEIEQYLALTGAPEYDFQVAARGFINMPGPKVSLMTTVDAGLQAIIASDSPPIVYCIGGYSEVIPGVWQSWMAGTDWGWRNRWRSITKASLWLREELFKGGARRVQTTALASRVGAIEWYEKALHLKHEGTWAEYGVNGEDVACYSMTRRDRDGLRE